MLYQEYKSKMDKVVQRLRRLNRYRVPIIATLATILVLVASFLFTRGMIYGATLKDTTIEYGDKPSFSASALFSDVRYEYSEASSDTWSEEVPYLIGEYRARAISKGSFGEKYGKAQEFKIVPKKIKVAVVEKHVVYGENPTVKAELAYNDRVFCGEFDFADTTLESTSVSPVSEAITVLDEKGRDVTKYYEVDTKTSLITFEKRELVLTVESRTKIYDGKEMTCEAWQAGEGGLAYGDVVVKVDGTFSTITNAGSVDNKAEFRLVRQTENGVADVTHQYSINQVYGTLTVEKKEILIHADGNKYIYDGAEHKEEGFTIDATTPLVDGHSAYVKEAPVIVNAGKLENILLLGVSDENGEDKTDNYCFTFDGSLLEVLPKEITVETESGTLVYDGFDHSFDGCTVADGSVILDGHRLVVTKATVIKDVQVAKNVLKAGVLDGSGNDVTGNYSITYIEGTIEITKRSITITSGDLDGIYSGLPQGSDLVSSGLDELCKDHKIVAEFKNTVTDCYKTVENEFTAIIVDANNVDVTKNYEPARVFGTLKLNPMPISLITSSDEKTYDATELKCESFEYAEGSLEIYSKHTVVYINAPSIVNAGETKNEFTIEIYDSDGVDKSFNYDINFLEYGTLKVLQRKVTVQALDAGKEYYDGQAVANPGYALSGEGVLPSHKETVDLAIEDDTNAGTWKNSVVSVLITDENGEDVTPNYEITDIAGTVEIGRRPITVISLGFENTVYYDGEKHINHKYFVDTENGGFDIVEGESLIVTFLENSYVELATESRLNMFTIIGVFKDATDENSTGNYTFTTVYGELELAKRPITVLSGSIDPDKIIYDGYAHTENSFEVMLNESSLGLAQGQRAYATYLSSIVDAGEIDNLFEIDRIYDKEGRNVVSSYEITYEYGKLRVSQRPITLTSQSASMIYNGTPLSNKEVLVSGDGLAFFERIEYTDFATITDFGSVKNTFKYTIYNIFGEDVTEKNYNIIEDFSGVLTVNKRPVTITVNSYSQIYDGTALTPNGVTTPIYDDYLTRGEGILPYHTVYSELGGSIYKAGSITIECNVIKIVDTLDGGIGDKATDNYDITVIDGTLTVFERDITIELKDQEKEYDADALLPTFTGEDLGGLGLAEGDVLEIILSGSQTNRGTAISSVVKYTITNPQGEDVTFCYNPTSIKDGSLTVHPRQIKITISDGYREYYDGAAVVSGGFLVDRLLTEKGHTIDLVIAGEQINVGVSAATLVEGSVKILAKNGEDVTDNYVYTSTQGTLTVEKKRPITVTSASDRFIYDGKAHKNETYEIGGMGLASGRAETEVVTFTNEPMVNAGTYENKFDIIIIVAANGENVTDNYEITPVFGTIVIDKITITVTTGSASKIFDGTPLTSDDISCICTELPANERIELTVTGTITSAGVTDNTYTIRVLDENFNERPIGNYEIISNLGKLTVEKLSITVTSKDAEKIWDGAPLTFTEYESDWETTEAFKKGVLNLAVVVTGSRTEIGRSSNNLVARIYDKDHQDVTEGNCEFTYVKGSLTVYAPTVEFVSQNATTTFTGKKVYSTFLNVNGHMNTKDHFVKKTFVSDTAQGGDFVYAGQYINEFTVEIVDKNGDSVMEFYPDIKYTFGTIEITPHEIIITPVSQKEQYEGKPLYPLQEIVEPNADMELLNSYDDENVFTYYIDEIRDIFASAPGEIVYFTIPADKFHVLMNGEAVPDSCFKITSEAAYLSLSSLLIEINVYNVTGTYNGREISYEPDEWYLRDDQLAKLPAGYRLEVELTGGRVEAGSIDFEEMLADMLASGKIHVYNSNNEDVTSSYDFKFVGNPLTVKQRFIQITAGSAEKIYDGTPLKSGEYSITGGKLAAGHSIKSCSIFGEQTEIGTDSNEILSVMIVDAKGNDVTSNYNTEFIDGILEVVKDPQEENN